MAKNFDPIVAKIQNQILEIVSRAFLTSVAKQAQSLIYKRVKSGKGATPDGSETRLTALSDRYIEYRKGSFSYKTRGGKGGGTKIKNQGKIKLGAFGAPATSNLTLTGEMLENIQYKVEKYGIKLFFPDTKHKIFKRVTIRELAQYVQENGRSFFYLTQAERRTLVRSIQTEVRKKFRRK